MSDLITVIIPVKDRVEELKRAVNSVVGQTHSNWELLVVDDKSTIDIKGCLKEFEDARINYYLNDKPNSNANVCRNIGLDNTKGDFVAMLDSDDEWLPNHLETRLDFLIDQKADGVFGGAYIDNGETRTLRLNFPFDGTQSMADYILKFSAGQTSSYFYTARSARKTHWDENLLRHQDYDFSIRYAEQFKFISCDNPTTIIHWRKGEKRTEDFDSQIKFMTKHESKFSKPFWKKFFTENFSNIKDRTDVPAQIKIYFKTAALRYPQFLSLADYQMIVGSKTTLQKIMTRFKFAFIILTQK